MIRRQSRLVQATIALAILIGGAAVVSWIVPDSAYLVVPDKALPLADRVTVPGEKPPAPGAGAVYYVDVHLRPAHLLERLFSFARPDGARLLKEEQVIPAGSSWEQQAAVAKEDMVRSEETASAVALRAAGYKVGASPEGVLIDAMNADAPARPELQTGDVVETAKGKQVRTVADLQAVMAGVRPGEKVALTVRRGTTHVDLAADTASNPDHPKRAYLGVYIAQNAKLTLPIKVDIDLGDVGGPSAGLPFALDVLQELGKDVTRGHRVAATGEIAIDGSIHAVGGIEQKTYGVREAGADVFLVPAGDNATEARRYAGNLKVIPVENFQQALRALRTLPAK